MAVEESACSCKYIAITKKLVLDIVTYVPYF